MGFSSGPESKDTSNTIIKHTERIVETPVFKEVIVEKPVFKPVTVEVPSYTKKEIEVQSVKVVENIHTITVDRVKYEEVVIERPVYKEVVIERVTYKDKIVEVIQKVPKIEYVVEFVKVEKVEIVPVAKEIEVPHIITRTVYVDRPVYQDRIFIREKFQYKCESCGHVHEEVKT